MALKEFSGDLIQEPKLKEFSGELDAPDSQGNAYTNAYKKLWGKLVPNGNDLRDVAAATLKIGPTALKGVGDLAQLVTGGNYGTGISNAMTEGMQAIDDVVGSPELRAQKQNVNAVLNDPTKGISDLASAVVQNPRAAVDAGVSTVGSLFLPTGAAKAVTLIPKMANSGKAATAAAIGTGGAMNAADTFTSIDSPDLGDKYTGAAISGLTSLGVGALTGGGAEGLIAKKIANDPSIRQTASNVFARLFGQPLKTMGKEGLQEAGEASGNYLGEVVGDGKEFNANQLGKRAAYEGALGAILGGGVGAATNTGGQPPGITIIGNPAPQPANPQAAANVANLIADTATMDSKLKPAPADIELTDTAQPTQDQPVDLNVAPTPDPTPATDDKIIQNRNRATPSSIAQMTAISAAPDYNRLSFSRDFANGAPVVAGGVIPAEQLGASDVAVASDGRRIPVQYAVVDASELLPSNQADGTENAAFYDNTIDAVRAIAGNGRIAGLQAAYGKNTADAYRTELEADTLHGIDPQVIAGMANPVLVRVMPQESVTADIGDVSNTVGNLELSPVEQANNDVQRVNLEALSFADDGSVTPQAVRQFVQAMPQAEQGSLLDTNGQPTKQAVDRLNAAIFAKAYNNDKLIRLYAQAQDAEARVVLSALAQVAPKMARLEGAGQLDIRQAVTDAAEIAVNARRNGLSITRAAQQVDITADPNVVEVLTLFAANVRSSKAVAEALGRAADFAYSEAIKPAEDMFGEVPKASRQEVFNQLGNTDEPASTQDLPDAQGAGGVSQDPARAAVFSRGQGDANGAGEGGSVNDTTARQDAADYGLDSYTNRDIVERLDRIEKAQKEAADRAKAEEAKRQADLERETFGLTGSESPVDRLEAQGQGRLFQAASAYNDPNYVEQRDLFLDYGPVESQDTQGGETAKRQASTALDDLHASGSVLGKALSRDYAANQRVSLVGQRIDSAADLATLAQVYRDPRFETFRLIFVNDAGRIVSQLGLTSRLPTSAQAIVGNDSDAYLSEVSTIAKQRGATRFWMLHNHPSGKARPSSADLGLTRLFTEKMPGLTNNGHVIIDTNEYGFIDPFATGEFDVRFKDFGAVEPMTAGEFTGFKITDAESVMELAKRIDVDADAVTLVAVDAQLRVQRITTVPVALVTESNAINRRTLLKETLSGNGYFIFAVGRNMQAVERLGRFSIDGVHVDDDGALTTLTSIGRGGEFDLFPNQRRPRVTPDTGNEFDYLRRAPTAQAMAAVREDEADFGPVLTQYRGNAQGAIQKLLELRTGDAEAALSHPDIGDIDLIYGKEGDPKYDYRDGFGLGKIASKHPEVLGDLQSIIASMRVTMRSENRVNLESDTHKGAVRLEWNGQRKTWLLTAFEKVADGASTRTDTTGLSGEGDTARSAAAAPSIVNDNGNNATYGVGRSSTNSDGRPIHHTAEGVRNFWRWFGDSKAGVRVNSETGLPATSSKETTYFVPSVMYHTTRNDFSEFEIGRITANSGTFGDWETYRSAIFVTPELEASQAYGKTGGKFDQGANVMPLYAKAENPIDLTSNYLPQYLRDQLEEAGAPARLLRDFGWATFDDADGKAFVNAARALGYDSAIFNDENPSTGESFEAWAIFSPEQIKSASGNNGNFDPKNASVVREDAAQYGNNSPQASMNLPAPGPRFDPIRTRDWFSTERAANGQRQYAAGRKLWDRASGYAAQYLGKIKLADTKPGAFKEMLRQFNVDKTKASQQAKRIAETGMNLTPEQRELLSDLVEKQAKVGDMVPEDVAKLAATMTAALDVQARDLVELGMLSEDRLVKNYLPRLYKSGLSGMLTNPTLMRSWFTKARMKIRGDRLMSRGMFEEIDANKVDQAKRLGWKVSSMPGGDPVPGDLLAAIDSGRDIPGQYRSAKVLMWRDYTEAERQQMGEIRDGVLRYALGYVETQKDIAIGRLFKAIANNSDLSKPYNPGGWVKVPSGEIKGAPGTKAYGALAGMWVEPQVADSLHRNTQPKGVLMAAYDKALSFWKEGKTVWNPVSHGNNVVSNLFTIYFAGINPANPKPWRETLREYRTKGAYYTEALDNGLFGNEWANKEIQDLLMPDFADMADMETVAASRVAKMVEFAKKTGKPVSWYRENMQKAYEFEDQFFKLMLYIDRRKAGMEPHAAITDAERYVFNYADMPEGVELIKRTLSPFFAYTYKAIPMVLHTAMTRPDRMLAPIMLLGGANWLAYMLLGADEEEERKGMPDYMDGRTAIGTQKAVRMPFNIGGQPAFLDMSRRVPLGDLFDINNQTGGMPLPAPFMPSHPVASMVAAVIFNKDLFTGRDLVKKSDTPWEAAKTRSSYVLSQFAPNAPFVPGSYNFNKLADATANMFDTEIGPYTGRTKSGDPIRMATVLPDVLTGTKIRTVDPQRGMAYQNAALDKEAQEIRANIRAAGRNKSMTDKSRQAYIDEQTEKLRLLGERRVELNQ